MSISVVIPSKSIGNLVPCISSVFTKDPLSKVIVVDDGIDFDGAEYIHHAANVTPGIKPFIFARNCNLGIRAAYVRDNIVLMNDDAKLETLWGFHEIEKLSLEHPELGLISAVTNVAGNTAQHPRGEGLRLEERTVAFVCVFIPRATIDRVGLLDERFTAYGWEDNDYCRRVLAAGLKIGIFDRCFVDHGSLKSTFRGSARGAGDISAGRRIYEQKWGAGAQ